MSNVMVGVYNNRLLLQFNVLATVFSYVMMV